MPKYLVFINALGVNQTNRPGSPEHLACEIANTISMQRMPKDYFLACLADSPDATLAMLRDTAKFSLELDDKSAAIWTQELQAISRCADRVEQQVDQAYFAIANAMIAYNDAIATSAHCQELPKLLIQPVEHAFDHFDIGAAFYVSDKLSELFAYQILDDEYT